MTSPSGTSINGHKLEPIKPQADVDPKLDYEFGVENVLPFSAWLDYTIRDNKGKRTISNGAEAVPIEQLVEMRRKDGQARALMRLITLPIRAALKDSEWVAPKEIPSKNKSGSDDDGPKPYDDVKLAGFPPSPAGPPGAAPAGGPPAGAPVPAPSPTPVVKPKPDKPSPGEKEVEFANLMFTLPPQGGGMTVSCSKFLRQTLLALTDGFSCFEEVRHVPESGPLKGKITIRKMAHRDARTINFNVDETGGFDGVRQRAVMNDQRVDVHIPKDKTWYYAANEEENPFYGVSYFEAAYRHYDFKRKLYYVSHVAAQFAAVPGRIGITPPSPDSRMLASFKTALANFAFNTALTVPEGYDVKEFKGSSQFDFLKLIDHHNMMMAASVLAKFLQQEDRQVLIDNGKADATADMFVLMVESIMNEIAESWSHHLMPKYIDWNFPDANKVYPVFRFGQLADPARDAIKEIFTQVVIAGALNCTPEFVRELEKKLAARLALDIDYDEIEQYEKDAAEAQQQAEQQAADQQQQLMDQASALGIPPGGPGTPGGPQSPPPGLGGGGGGGQPAFTKPAPRQGPGPAAMSATSGYVDVDDLVAAAARLLTHEEYLGPELD